MVDNPIVIRGIKEYKKVKNKQREYINENFAGYIIISTIISTPKDDKSPFIQSFILENSEGKIIQIYFDLTNIYKMRNKKCNKDLNEMIKQLDSIGINSKK